MTAVWIAKTVRAGRLLHRKAQLIGGDNIDALRRFFRSVAGVHSSFRHDFDESQWSAAHKLFSRLGLKPDPESSNDFFLQNVKWASKKKGLFFVDVKGQGESSFVWHTMGLYFGNSEPQMQWFDPNIGLYEFDSAATGVRALHECLKEGAPAYNTYVSTCYRFEFQLA